MTRRATLGLVLLYGGLYLLPLGFRPLAVPDETRYAEMGREILATGDWIVPRLNGLRYFEKPMLGPWCQALCLQLFGPHAWVVRLPSALAVGLTALVLFAVVCRGRGDPDTALFAAGIYLTCGLVFGIGTFAVLDSLLNLFVTATLGCLFLAYREPGRRRRWLAVCGLAAGLAFLTKGFLALVVPGLVLVAFLAWQRRGRRTGELLRQGWPAVLTALATVLPWCLLIAYREPDFWPYFFWVEHVQRFLHASGAQHPQPVWFYLPVLLLGALPWAWLLAPAVVGLRRAGDRDGLLRFAVCWLAVPLAFFSLCQGKLITYVLPCFAPLAVLLAVGLQAYERSGTRRLLNGLLLAGAGVCGLLALALALGQGHTGPLRLYAGHEAWKGWVLVAGLLTWGGLLLTARRSRSPAPMWARCCLAPALFMASLGPALPVRLHTRHMPGALLRRQAPQLRGAPHLFADDVLAPAVCWFTRRRDVRLLGRSGELAYGLGYPDSRARFVAWPGFRDFLKRHPDRPVVFVTRARDYEQEYRLQLPEPTQVWTQDGFALAVYGGTTPAPSCP